MVQARTLPYAGMDARWEEQQFAAFQQLQRAQQGSTAASYADFVFGRLLEEDLHVSCTPILPAHVDQLHGVTIQGMCILQIVDVVNIGANFEQRKEDIKGPTRTLKICFTDGHQLVYGFEYRWLPSFSLSLLHGTKVVVLNVDIRHGLLMLTPQNCRLLGLSGNDLLEQASKNASAMAETPSAVSSGAYSAALMTAQFTPAPTAPREQQRTANVLVHQQPQLQSVHQPVALADSARPPSANARIQPPSASPVIQHESYPPAATAAPMHDAPPSSSIPAHPGPPPIHAFNGSAQSSIHMTSHQSSVASGSTMQRQLQSISTVTPPVFVDVISSDDDCDSDKTDPMVQHLFYSPNTPRLPEGASLSDKTGNRSRKRPREAIAVAAVAATSSSSVIEVSSSTEFKADAFAEISNLPEDAFSFSLLGTASASTVMTSVNGDPPLDPSSPFQYFSARSTALSAAENPILDDVLHIRACIKSVAGFQFNTGLYLLKVIIEDCTETKEVSVDAKFVEKLMGVSCLEFMRAMQKTPAVAHQWAARMQFALMTLEGVMDFCMNPNGTFTLLDCRDVNAQDTKALLQRVRASVSR